MVCGQNRSSLRGDGGLAQMPMVDTEESLLHQGLLVTMEMRREEGREFLIPPLFWLGHLGG